MYIGKKSKKEKEERERKYGHPSTCPLADAEAATIQCSMCRGMLVVVRVERKASSLATEYPQAKRAVKIIFLYFVLFVRK